MKMLTILALAALIAAAAADQQVDAALKDGLLKPCRGYVSSYGFYEPAKACKGYCCGSCNNRYCCDSQDEALHEQNSCANNFDNDTNSLPQKSQTCLSYTDSYENVIIQVKCAEDDFCTGTCWKRRCGKVDYEWLDQSKCQNTVNPVVDPTTADPEPYSSTTESPWLPVTNVNFLYMIGSITVITILFFMVLILLCKLNRMEQYIRRVRYHEQITSMRIKLNDDAPPSYQSGYRY